MDGLNRCIGHGNKTIVHKLVAANIEERPIECDQREQPIHSKASRIEKKFLINLLA